MFNSLLNRYYITNVNRSKVFADTQQKLEAILAQGKIQLPEPVQVCEAQSLMKC